MDCVFCNLEEYRIIKYNNFSFDRVIHEDKHWVVVPTLGAFLDGYILLISKKHSKSSYLCSPREISSLSGNIYRMFNIYKKVYRKKHAYIFEHGSIDDNYASACCVDHTHIHMFPSPIDIYDAVAKKFIYGYTEHKSLHALYAHIRKRNIKSYLLFGDLVYKRYILIDASENIYPSQYLRQTVYSLFNNITSDNKWDWRHNPMIENTYKIKKEIELNFKSNE